MPKMIAPPHPKLDIDCTRCRHWLTTKKDNIVMTPQGPVPVKEFIKAGQSIEHQPTATVAPCTLDPMWQLVTEDHWCSRWESRDRD